MAYPTTRETHVAVTATVTEIQAEHVNWGFTLLPRIEDYVGLEGDTADPAGSITAQVKDLQEQLVGSSFPTEIASATHGPASLVITNTSGHDMVAAPGSGLAVFVTSIAAWNEAATASRLTASDGVADFVARLAATDGAGFVHAFDPPWECPEDTAFEVTMSIATTALVTVNFYTAEPTV